MRTIIVEARPVRISARVDERETMDVEVEGWSGAFGRVPNQAGMNELELLLELERLPLAKLESCYVLFPVSR